MLVLQICILCMSEFQTEMILYMPILETHACFILISMRFPHVIPKSTEIKQYDMWNANWRDKL